LDRVDGEEHVAQRDTHECTSELRRLVRVGVGARVRARVRVGARARARVRVGARARARVGARARVRVSLCHPRALRCVNEELLALEGAGHRQLL